MQQNTLSEISKVSKAIVSPLLPDTNLPLELICLILSKLPIENLERLWVFNQDWFILIKAFCLDFYRSAFQESLLWASLPPDPGVENISLFTYFKNFLGPEWLKKLPARKCVNLEKLITIGMSSPQIYDDLLVGINRAILLEEEKYLIQQRQLTDSTTITDFLANPPSNWLKMAKAYRHLEATLTILLLALCIYADDDSFSKSIFLVLDTRLTRWLSGSGLAELHRRTLHNKPLILSHLIDFALGEGELFLKCSSEKQPVYQQNAKDLLYRLNDDNCRALLGSQRLVLVSAIKRHCLPIIDSLGPHALERVIEENPDDEMLLVLLEQLGAARLSRALASIPLKSFPKIVNECSKFMFQLLVAVTLEQMCDIIKPLLKEQFVCLLNSQAFIDFFKELDVQQKRLMIENPPLRPIAITCSPSELLLYFYKAQPDHKNEIISSQFAEYLEPREILIFLQEGTPFWNSFPQSKLLQKFTQLNDFIELYLKYDDYCKQYGYFDAVVPKEIQEECLVRVCGKKIVISNPELLDLIFWNILVKEKQWTTFCKPHLLTCDNLEKAKQACIPGVHVKLLERINRLWNQKAEEQAQSFSESTGESSADDAQEPDETSPREEGVDNSDSTKTIVFEEFNNEEFEQPFSMLPNVSRISEPPADSQEPVFLLPETRQPLTPLVTFSVNEPSLPTQSNDLTLPKKPTVIAEAQSPVETRTASQQPISTQLNHNASPQNSTSMNIALSIAKGLFVGLLVMCITMLLIMFFTYEPHALLMDTLVSNLFIGGIAGAFAWVVATACFLADAKICATTNANVTSEEDNPTHSYIKPVQNVPTVYSVDPSNHSDSLFAESAANTSIPLVSQKSKTPFLGNGFNIEPQ